MIEHFKKYWIAYTLLAAAIIIGIVLAWNWTKWFGSDYDKCLEYNKSKAEDAACTGCIPEGSAIAAIQGIIKDGVCVPIGEPPLPKGNGGVDAVTRYGVTNPEGADVYIMQRGSIRSEETPAKVVYGTEVKITGFSTDKEYANTNQGWLSVKDIGVI